MHQQLHSKGPKLPESLTRNDHGELTIDNVPVSRIAAKIPTPFYSYSLAQLSINYKNFYEPLKELNPIIAYAVKANSSRAVIEHFGSLGSGADVVSLGELKKSIAAGVDPQKIIFSGVGKHHDELSYALKKKSCKST
jgi:diaminopimelate decarboxylase